MRLTTHDAHLNSIGNNKTAQKNITERERESLTSLDRIRDINPPLFSSPNVVLTSCFNFHPNSPNLFKFKWQGRQSKSRSSSASASTKKENTNTMESEVEVAEESSASNRVPSTSLVELVDDSYFAALIDEDDLFPISDEKYSHSLTFQECLFSSIVSSSSTMLSENKYSAIPSISVMKMEKGESSKAFCIICMDAKTTCEIFGNNCCSHSFCQDCISKYVAAKIQENIIDVKCPEPKCSGVLEPCSCRSIIPKEVLDRWEAALCESLTLESQRFYCPFKDCSSLMESGEDEDDLTACECPYCHRLFCARCKVPWHCGVNCEMFQNLKEDERGNDDIKAMQLAKVKDWKRCPKCSFYVEKTSGCLHILCRCGCEFCYGCGALWSSIHVCPPRATA